jgi:hypothetical protein
MPDLSSVDRRTRWAVPHEQATEWAMTDTDNNGELVPRSHRVTPGGPLHALMLKALDEDVVAFTLSKVLAARPPMLNFGIDVGSVSLMTKSGGFYDMDIPAVLDDFEATDACPLTRAEAVMLALRANPRPTGAPKGSAYADMCLHDTCPEDEACGGEVVRWRLSWNMGRTWITASIPYPLRLLAEPSLADDRNDETFLPDM